MQILIVAEIPKGPTGKLNRIGMAAALGLSAGVDGPTSRASDGPFVAPRTELEATLANLFSAILKVERVGVLDVFFELGGDSMLATGWRPASTTCFKSNYPGDHLHDADRGRHRRKSSRSGGDFGGRNRASVRRRSCAFVRTGKILDCQPARSREPRAELLVVLDRRRAGGCGPGSLSRRAGTPPRDLANALRAGGERA